MSERLTGLVERSASLLRDAKKLEEEWRKNSHQPPNIFYITSLASQGATLIHSVAGSKSVYAENLRNVLKLKSDGQKFYGVAGVLQAFHLDLAQGHLVNIRHEVEALVVSEILSQAKLLAKSKGIHPAAATIVACAALEEFLRNWTELKKIPIPEKQRSLSKYAQELRNNQFIDLPIERRIQSWVDYRNDAAHGSR